MKCLKQCRVATHAQLILISLTETLKGAYLHQCMYVVVTDKVMSVLTTPVFVILQRCKTYFSGKDSVSYSLILLLPLFNGLATSPILQWDTNLTGQRRK